MSEQLMRLLAELPAAEPEPVRAERIKRSCRARLARHAERSSDSTRAFAPVWRLCITALGAAYMIGALIEAVRVYRVA